MSLVLAFLEATESMCSDSDALAAAILVTQTVIATELLQWHTLLDDMELCIGHAHKLAAE